MRRRDFIAMLVGAAAWPRASQAQQGKAWRVAQVAVGTQEIMGPFTSVLEEHLVGLGDRPGENFVMVTRFVRPDPKVVQEEIAALSAKIDLLVVWSTVGGVAAKRVSPPVPIVFLSVGAPVEIGLVESLARPGGNMTGVTFESAKETYPRRLQLLKELVPNLDRVALLRARGDANASFATGELERAAPRLGVTLVPIDISSPGDLDRAFAEVETAHVQGLLAVAGALTFTLGKQIAELALAHRLPSCFAFKETVKAGGLIALAPDIIQIARQGATYVDKIIHGSKPGDLPIQQPSRYALYINLKTANALGVTVPSALFAGADEVIE